MKRMKYFFGCLLLAGSFQAQAHRIWLLPSSTVISGDEAWVTVDAAVANGLFVFDHVPLRTTNLTVEGPDGKPLALENLHTGKLRTVFDLHLKSQGTYKLAVNNAAVIARYKEDGKEKRIRTTLDKLDKEIPKDAEDLEITESMGRVESYITLGKPSTQTLKPSQKGLEVEMLSHPNDLAKQETSRFRFLANGKPAKELSVSVIPGGTRYRDASDEVILKTDSEGAISITWPESGMYYVSATMQDDATSSPRIKQRRLSYAATLEVLP